MNTSSLRRRPQGALSHTAFVSSKVQLDILEAMHNAVRMGHSDYLLNRRRRPWLRVDVKTDSHGRRYYQFLDRQGRPVGHTLRRAVMSPAWNLYFRRRFLDLEQALLPKGDERVYATFGVRHIIAATNVTLVTPTQCNATERRH